MARIGVITAMLGTHPRIMTFRTARTRFHIPRSVKNCWEMLQPLLDLAPQNDWKLAGSTYLSMFIVNYVYHIVINRHKWMEGKVQSVWGLSKPMVQWCLHVLDIGWRSPLRFCAKVFIWRIIIGELPLGDALQGRNITTKMCFFWMVGLECTTQFYCLSNSKIDSVVYYNNLWASIFRVTIKRCNGFYFMIVRCQK